MPELPVVGDAPSKAVGGAGEFIQKRVAGLPLWAWAAAAGLSILALRLMSPLRGRAIGGAGIAMAQPIQRPVVSPGVASGVGSFVAPAPYVAALAPASTLTMAGPSTAAVASTPALTARSSHIGSTPAIIPQTFMPVPSQQIAPPSPAFISEPGWFDVGQYREKFVAHETAPVVGVITDPAAWNLKNAPGGGYSAP